MKKFLRRAGCLTLAVGIVAALGIGFEMWKQRGLGEWAEEVGGSFTPGGVLDGVEVPEAEPFRADSTTFHNVIRLTRGEVGIVLATRHRSTSTGIGRTRKTGSSEDLVAFVTVPGGDFPAVGVWPPRPAISQRMASAVGFPEPPPPLEVQNAVEGFREAFEVCPLESPSEAPEPAALQRLLPREVQWELVAAGDALLPTLQARGNVVLVRSGVKKVVPDYQGLLALVERLAEVWSR